jgi:sugar phosphate isomerase/epimerase
MKRRDFLEVTAGALLAGSATVRPTFGAQSAGPSARSAASGGLKVDIYSRHLQWLRTADEVAAAAIEMGYDGVNVTVRPYPGHVNPENVGKELPPFVAAIRKHGLLVRSITTNISDADSPNAEQIVAAASALGITHYWWGTYRYDLTKPIIEQLDALKPRVAKIAAMSEKYKMTAAYHTYSMAATIGSTVWDLLYLLRDHDPKYVGFHWDTGHESHHLNGMSEVNLRAAGPYVVALAVKDYAPEQNLGLRGEGGPYTGPPGALGGRGDGPPPNAGARGTAPGRGGAGGPQRGGDQSRGDAPGRGADAAGRGGRGRGAPEGAGATWAAGNGWRTRSVPLGMGLVNLPQVAAALKDIHFSGPVEIQAEYPNGGAENAQDAITLPREQVLGAMKRDLLTLRRAFSAAGLLSIA